MWTRDQLVEAVSANLLKVGSALAEYFEAHFLLTGIKELSWGLYQLTSALALHTVS